MNKELLESNKKECAISAHSYILKRMEKMKTISPLVKAAAEMTGANRHVLAARLEINAQSLTNKYTRDSFSAVDLVKIASACGYRLAFTDEAGKAVIMFPDTVKSE